MKTIQILTIILWSFGLVGCSYLGSTLTQAGLSARFNEAPSQKIYKHMLESENYFVFGKLENGSGLNSKALALVAFSNDHRNHEVVDISHFADLNSYYGLNLPAGHYMLVVVSDLNHDGYYDADEIVGNHALTLEPSKDATKVIGELHIDLSLPEVPFQLSPDFHVAVKTPLNLIESLFYPKGSIRSLDDDIFSPRMTNLGLYEPAAFLEEAPMMFYALEEDFGYKIPVVFVHGIDGSPRDFAEIVARLDRTRYRPWFFYYPSGNDLSQLGEMFYSIFLSGKTMPLGNMGLVIVAHSMGGLVVREALNHMEENKRENHVAELITMASPLGGHPAAAMASQGPVVIPSWRDVDPNSKFMRKLRRKKLPAGLEYQLIYAFGNEKMIKIGENSDGVVPLSSQLCSEAQAESTAQFGINETHTGILTNKQTIDKVLETINAVKSPFPEDHMAELLRGGYEVPLVGDYTPLGRYCIRYVGYWMEALAGGRLTPQDELQAHFVKVVQGLESPNTPVERDWQRFVKEYPQRTGL